MNFGDRLSRRGGRFGFPTTDKHGRTRQVEALGWYEIESMEKKLEEVDRFLSLEGTDRLSQSVKQCFVTWSRLLPLQEENDRAEIVLSAYYQSGKIQDTLAKLACFVKRMDAVDGADTARGMAYHNYIFFLEEYVRAMKLQYEKVKLCAEPPVCTPDNTAWFIQAECSQIAPIQDLPKVRTAARQMLEQAEEGKRPPERFYDTARNLGIALEILQLYQKKMQRIFADESYGAPIEALKKLNESLYARAKALKENIKKGSELYDILVRDMTEEWFLQFDPEAGPVRDMTQRELKAFYQEQLSALQLPKEEKG